VKIDPNQADSAEEIKTSNEIPPALDTVLENSNTKVSPGLPSAHFGKLVEFDGTGYPMVDYQGHVYRANSLAPISRSQLGQRCALAFEDGDLRRPLILGVLWDPAQSVQQEKVIQASESLTLECGQSSLELESNGTVRLKGVTVTTQAYGSNRVKGAAVKIN